MDLNRVCHVSKVRLDRQIMRQEQTNPLLEIDGIYKDSNMISLSQEGLKLTLALQLLQIYFPFLSVNTISTGNKFEVILLQLVKKISCH